MQLGLKKTTPPPVVAPPRPSLQAAPKIEEPAGYEYMQAPTGPEAVGYERLTPAQAAARPAEAPAGYEYLTVARVPPLSAATQPAAPGTHHYDYLQSAVPPSPSVTSPGITSPGVTSPGVMSPGVMSPGLAAPDGFARRLSRQITFDIAEAPFLQEPWYHGDLAREVRCVLCACACGVG